MQERLNPTRRELRMLEAENKKHPEQLMQIPLGPSAIAARQAQLMPNNMIPIEAWRSRGFLVQIFEEAEGILRMSVCRTSVTKGQWTENITWDELQRLKSESGRGDREAVEIYPPDGDVVNVANMRHLWILSTRTSFSWRTKPDFSRETKTTD